MISVNELFSGIGAQAKALERLGLEHNIVATSDLDMNAIVSYAAIHNGLTLEMIDSYSEYPTRSEMADYLLKLNIGYDFKKNKAYDWHKLARKKSKEIEKYYLATIISKQVGDVSKVEKLPKADLWTYSFPCSDI
ncbi:MAG: DNA (cytosine-5-)-methyltransferase, partial [Oscillospiraceae bacterium]